jgi:hypothetical protein
MTPRQRIKRIARLTAQLPRLRLPHQVIPTIALWRRKWRIENIEELLRLEVQWLASFAIESIDDETLDAFPPGHCDECGRKMASANANDDWLCDSCATSAYDYPEP